MDTITAGTRSRWWPLVAICLGTFMLLVDVTIVSVALPSMARDLHAGLSSLQWVVDAYALSLAALLLVSGSLADRFGRRRAFQVGLVLFAGASLCCALAPNAGLLIAARTVQGVGAAAMFATNSALVNATYKGRDRGVAFGVWGAVVGAAAALAPILGGLLIDGFDWRAIFLVNLPIAAIAIVMTQRVLSESHGHGGRLDWVGAFWFTLSSGSVTFALIHGGEAGWGATATVVAFAVAAVALIVFLVVEPRRLSPLMDLTLLRDRSFATLMLAAVALSVGAFAPLLYTQLWLQSVLNMSAIDAGLVVAPLAAVAFVVSAGIGRFMHRVPPQFPLGVGLLAIGGGALLRTGISAGSGWGVLIPGLLLTGIGVGLGSPVLISATLAAVHQARAGMASGIVNTFRTLGYALGIAALGTLFTDRIERTFVHSGVLAHPRAAAAQASQGGAQGLIAASPPHQHAPVAHLVHAAYATSQNSVYLIAGLAALVGGAAVLAFVRPAAEPERTLEPHDAAADDVDAKLAPTDAEAELIPVHAEAELRSVHAGGAARA
jgi:EmrB/QacA subfamily drug resistance transporter